MLLVRKPVFLRGVRRCHARMVRYVPTYFGPRIVPRVTQMSSEQRRNRHFFERLTRSIRKRWTQRSVICLWLRISSSLWLYHPSYLTRRILLSHKGDSRLRVSSDTFVSQERKNYSNDGGLSERTSRNAGIGWHSRHRILWEKRIAKGRTTRLTSH